MTNVIKKKPAPRRKPKGFVDRRRLVGKDRVRPTTGQSAAGVDLSWDKMGEDERQVMIALDGGSKRGPRLIRSIAFLADALEGDQPRLRARNALRRPVAAKLVERTSRGHYRLAESGRKLVP